MAIPGRVWVDLGTAGASGWRRRSIENMDWAATLWFRDDVSGTTDLRGLTVVVSEHPAEVFSATNLARDVSNAVLGLDQTIADSLMIQLGVVVRKVRGGRTLQRWFSEEDYPIQALGLQTS